MEVCYGGRLLLVRGGGRQVFEGGAGWAGGFQGGEGGESYGCGVLCVGCVVMGHAAIPRD